MRIYVGNLSYEVSDEELREEFSAYGEVTGKCYRIEQLKSMKPVPDRTIEVAGLMVVVIEVLAAGEVVLEVAEEEVVVAGPVEEDSEDIKVKL